MENNINKGSDHAQVKVMTSNKQLHVFVFITLLFRCIFF